VSIPLDVISLLGGMATFALAKSSADRISRKLGETRFVLRESNHFYVVSLADLDTFFSGSEECIIYSTEEVQS
jgi:hypothetical protein